MYYTRRRAVTTCALFRVQQPSPDNNIMACRTPRPFRTRSTDIAEKKKKERKRTVFLREFLHFIFVTSRTPRNKTCVPLCDFFCTARFGLQVMETTTTTCSRIFIRFIFPLFLGYRFLTLANVHATVSCIVVWYQKVNVDLNILFFGPKTVYRLIIMAFVQVMHLHIGHRMFLMLLYARFCNNYQKLKLQFWSNWIKNVFLNISGYFLMLILNLWNIV